MTMLKQFFLSFSVSCLRYTRCRWLLSNAREFLYSNIHDIDVIKSDGRNRMELSKIEIKIVVDKKEFRQDTLESRWRRFALMCVR